MPFKWLLLTVLIMPLASAWGQVHLDSTFGTNGVAKISLDDYNEAVRVMKLADDTLLLLANVTPIDSVVKTDFAVIKLTPDGAIDSSFGTNGYVRYHFYKKEVSNARAFLRLPNGQLLIWGAGSSSARPLYLPACLMKLNADGSVDSTFGNSGTLDIQFDGKQEFPTSMKLLASGKVLLGGYSIDTTDTHSEVPVIARIDANGNFDTTFGVGGKVYLRFGGGFIHSRHLIGGLLYDMLEMPDSSVLVSGGYSNLYNLVGFIMRLFPTGAIDTSFVSKGYLSADFTTLYSSQIVKMAHAADGKVWLAANSNAAQDRDFYYGYIDFTNASYNTSAIDYQGNEDVVTDILLDDNGNPVMSGKSIRPANNHNGYVSDYFAIDQQPAANYPFNDKKFIFTDDTTVQCGSMGSVLQSDNRIVCFGFQNRPNNTSQLMLIRAKLDNPVGIENVAYGNDALVIYPNPASNLLHIKVANGNADYRLVVYSALGEKVAEQAISATTSIDISKWANGVYLLHVTGSGYLMSKRIVKQ